MAYNVFENWEVENKWLVIFGCRGVRNILDLWQIDAGGAI